MPTLSADVAVLGGGPAGLAAAWQAARRGFSVVVLERAPQVGGLAASFDVAGVRVDHGSHRLHPATAPHVLAAIRDLLGDDLQTRPRNGRIRLYDRWFGFPLRGGELARHLPRAAVARIARDALARPLRAGPAASYASLLRARLGRELYDALYAPYAVKLWGLPGEQIDVEQARRRVTADSPWKIARRVLAPPSGGQGRVFHYPRRGFGQLVDALAEAAVAAGATIRAGAEVTQLRPGGPATVETADGTTVQAGRVFSTVPLPALARLVRPAPPAPVLEAAAELGFRAMALVYLAHDGGRWTPYDAHYVPGAETPVTRLSEPANYRDSSADPADRTVLCAELPCAPDDEVWASSDDDLAALVRDGIARVGLPEVRLGGVHVRRVRHVYPVYRLGFGERLAPLDAWAATLPGVTTFGRLGLYAHDNTHHALDEAWSAVAALRPDGGWDAAAWAAARDRFARHVVED